MSATQPSVSWDDRPALERARRRQLLDVAKARNIFLKSENIPKSQILQLLEANGVNLKEPVKELDWYVVNGKDEQGNNHQEMYPVIPEHQSARQNINYEQLMKEQIEKHAEEKQESEDVIATLMKRLEALEANSIPLARATIPQLKKKAKDKGLDITGVDSKEALLQLLDE